MKRKLTQIIVAFLIITGAGCFTTNMINTSAATISYCDHWSIYDTSSYCDYNSGYCYWNDWRHSHFTTYYSSRWCYDADGRRVVNQLDARTTKTGCCE